MPIKFRCSYCRQFLGISRGRAGEVVDCPTCGRSIRVPGLDGAVLPVTAPELNRQDAKLMRALDELAHWESPPAAAAVAAAEQAPEEEAEIPQPIAEPIPIEVPVAPDPISIQPPPVVESAREPDRYATEAPPPMNVAQALEELQQLADSKFTPAVVTAQPATVVAPPARKSRTTWIVLGAMAAVIAFLAGYILANRRGFAPAPTELPQPVAPVADSAASSAIAGRISYHTTDGSSRPDRGARVLVLPREREGEAKLPVVGFRAGDHPADVRVAQAALQALGGDYAIADDGGQFEIRLPNPGTFHIIVISRYADRSDAALDPELSRMLTPFFDQPAQLLGRTKIHFGQVRYKGTGAEIWDHAF